MLSSSLFWPGWSICKWRTSDNFYFCMLKQKWGRKSVCVCGWGVSAVQRSKRTNSVEEGVCHRDKWGSVQWGTPVPVVPAASSDTDNPSDKPQLPRCTVSLSKRRQYCWQFCTLLKWGFVQPRICRYTRTISVHTHAHGNTIYYIYLQSCTLCHTHSLSPLIMRFQDFGCKGMSDVVNFFYKCVLDSRRAGPMTCEGNVLESVSRSKCAWGRWSESCCKGGRWIILKHSCLSWSGPMVTAAQLVIFLGRSHQD